MEQRTQPHIGKYKFFCKGKILTGPRPIAFIIVFFSLNILAILEIAFPCVYFVQEGSYSPLILSMLLLIFTNFLLIKTSCTDPGIIPSVPTPNIEDMGGTFTIMNSSIVKVKYCETCNIIRPPRASHCDECDACIERMDHHCPYLGCCIGRRNYLSFVVFIISITLFCALGTAICIVYIPHSLKEKSFSESMKNSPLIIPLIMVGLLFSLFLLMLCAYHLKIILQGRTTHEDIKELDYKIRPFDKMSMLNNIYSSLFISKPKSRIRKGQCYINAPFEYPLKRSRSGSLNFQQKSQSDRNLSYITTPPIADPDDCIQLNYSELTPEEVSESGNSELIHSRNNIIPRRENSCQKPPLEEAKCPLSTEQRDKETNDHISDTFVNSPQKPAYEDAGQKSINILDYQDIGKVSMNYMSKARSKIAPEPILDKPVNSPAQSPFELARSIGEDCIEPSENIKSFSSSEREDSTLMKSWSLKRSKSVHQKNGRNMEISHD